MKCQKCGLDFEGTYCPNGCNTPKQCPKCKTFYNGNFCPNGCNSFSYQKQKKKSNIKLAVILSVIVIIFAFAATMGILYGEEEPEYNNVSSENVSSEETTNYIEVSANDLWKAFSDNEVLAEKTYTGKNIKVTGVVSEINSGSFITTANVLLNVDNAMFSCVQCNFQKKDVDKLAELKKGQTVTIIGVCSDLDLNVQVVNCKVE